MSPDQIQSTGYQESTHENDLENYLPYRWFIGLVGGKDVLIPLNHSLPWRLNIRIKEIAAITKIKTPVNDATRRLLNDVEKSVGFNIDRADRYRKDSEGDSPVLTAHEFFVANALGERVAKLCGDSIDRETKREIQAMKDSDKAHPLLVKLSTNMLKIEKTKMRVFELVVEEINRARFTK